METFSNKQLIRIWTILLVLVVLGFITHKLITKGSRINLKSEFISNIPDHLVREDLSNIIISSQDIRTAIQSKPSDLSNGLKAGYLPDHFYGFMTTYHPLFINNVIKKTPYFVNNIFTNSEYGILKHYQPPKKEHNKLMLTIYPINNGHNPISIDITNFEQSENIDSLIIYKPSISLTAVGLDTINLLTPEHFENSAKLTKEKLLENQ